jgi:hypothetical protein
MANQSLQINLLNLLVSSIGGIYAITLVGQAFYQENIMMTKPGFEWHPNLSKTN